MKPIFRGIGKLIPVYWQGTEPGEAVAQWHGPSLYKAKRLGDGPGLPSTAARQLPTARRGWYDAHPLSRYPPSCAFPPRQ